MININDWAGKDDIRHYLNTPHELDGRTVASNGHVILSMPSSGNYQTVPDKYRDMYDKALSVFNNDLTFVPFPNDLEWPAKSKIPNRTTCPECDGQGEVNLENDFSEYYGIECKTCDGIGDIVEPGAGRVDGYKSTDYVRVLDLAVKPDYLQLIANEQNLLIAIDMPLHRLFFKCDGDIFGIICGMEV